MNRHATIERATPLTKIDPASSALKVTGRDTVAIKAGTMFEGRLFGTDVAVEMPELVEGCDYGVTVAAGRAIAWRTKAIPVGEGAIGGFHFAPGGNAPDRAGGDDIPAINPFSLWDLNFRPACPDPRGMALIDGQFWCDIYLTGVNHLADGTSRFGVTIADGDDCPLDPQGKPFRRFDYATAVAVMAHHGKGLLSPDEFYAAAFGVTEKTALRRDPKITGLDAPRSSKFGLMQATGNLWVWGHDGTPARRASLFGGSGVSGGDAGSRCASVGCHWPGLSSGVLGARGRSDHLQPV